MPLSRPRFPVPGLDALREAAAHYLSAAKAPAPRLPRDLVAGVNTAIVAVPGNMAASLLVGVNPLFGLYAGMVGPLVGGAASSTQLMIVTATTAAALTAGQSLTATPAAQREPTLAVMVVVVGILLLLLGGLRLTVIMRFVSYSVMTGLLTGISVVIVLSQLPLIAGYAANGGNRLAQTYDLFTHLSGVHLQSVAVAALTLALAVLLPRTGVRHAGILLAMVIPSVLIHLIHWDSVPLVSTAGALAPGLPALRWPAWEMLHFAVITGAASVTVIILVQSTGVSQEAPNPDGAPIRLARDFLAQGAANLVAGFLQSLPVGGSVSETALSIASGARTRWAAIFSGLSMALVLLVATAWVGQVALAALEALLIFAGISSLQWARIHSVWRNGWHARVAGVATFAAVLLLPMQAAVGIGMALSGLLYLAESAADIRVLQLRELPDGRVQELPPPRNLVSRRPLVLQVYGHLFYASAPALQRLLPRPGRAEAPVVILRLRGYATLSTTLMEVLDDYSHELETAGGRLYLSGLSDSAHEELRRSGKLDLRGPLQVHTGTSVLGESTRTVLAHAQAWLVRARTHGDDAA